MRLKSDWYLLYAVKMLIHCTEPVTLVYFRLLRTTDGHSQKGLPTYMYFNNFVQYENRQYYVRYGSE